jgi:hypothetical protein
MDSFFFNITDTKYKKTKLFEEKNKHITRVDISNGVVFFDIDLQKNEEINFHIKNLDRMVIISTIQNGEITLNDKIKNQNFLCKKDEINIFCSSKQDLQLTIKKNQKSKAFILFIADFFLKRYLSSNDKEPLDFLYKKIQTEVSCELINAQPIDALSLYIINKSINSTIITNDSRVTSAKPSVWGLSKRIHTTASKTNVVRRANAHISPKTR